MGRALSLQEWLLIEDEIDAFSIISTKDKRKKKEYYRILFSDSAWLYEVEDYERVLYAWKILDQMGEIDI